MRVGVRVCFIRPSRVIISSNNMSYDLNRKEFNVLLAVALVTSLFAPWISSEIAVY